MKPLLHRLAGRRAFASGLPTAATLLLLAALPATAQTSTPYAGTGWVIGVPVLPEVCTNGAGQVLLRANVQTLRVDGTDARFPGRRSVFTDGAYQADGSALIYGTCYHEVGTWDATGTNFTATGGIWEINWRGVMQTDYSLQLSLAGYGSGGSIDGLRMAETATRAAASAPIDPTVPLLYTGTIKPPPVNASEIVDNFDDNLFTGTLWGMGTVTESNQQFIARGSFAGVHTTSIQDSWVGGKLKPNTTWIVPDGMTKEWRADLVSLDENATTAAILLVGNEGVGGYNFMKGRDFASLNKWSSDLRISMLACEKVALRNTNVVLALALTRVNPNLVITIRVLDKADPNTVLYQHSVVDSPSADPTLTTAQFQALTGMRWLDLDPDGKAAPYTSFGVVLGVFQYTDGEQPAPTAIFDNLELRTSEVPGIGIERAVRLAWPASATINYAVEGAPTVQGPWLPVQELPMPGMQQVTVPTSEAAKFFRLRQAP